MKKTVQKETPKTYSLSHCNFEAKPADADTVRAAIAIAEAAAQNAKALQAVAAMLKGPDSLLRIP